MTENALGETTARILLDTRSILFRSAASLAMDCGKLGDAERLIAGGLSGHPPEEIAEELRQLLDILYFERHLQLRQVALEANELRMVLAGRGVGNLIRADEFVKRSQYLQGLVTRTTERKWHKPYRRHGRVSREVKHMQIYIGAAEAASFAVTLRVSEPLQLTFGPTSIGAAGVIDEILDCLELVNRGQNDILRSRIPDSAYYRDFVAKAINIAPDGQDVNLVAFAMKRAGVEKQVALTTPRRAIRLDSEPTDATTEERWTEATGELRYAKSTKQDEIGIIEEDGTFHRILVQEGLDDIVTSLWNEQVEVSGYSDGEVIKLVDIRQV